MATTVAKVPTTNTASKNALEDSKKLRFNQFLKSPTVLNSIESTLGSTARTKTFVASIISAVNTNSALAQCDNTSIVSAALLGESLRLSPSPQLGQYYMVPFNDKNKGNVATFILGWKGYYQLAMRSGVYKTLHATPIKEGEIVKCDPITEEYEFKAIENPTARKKAETVGYYAFFETVNGFKKSMYWTKEEMEQHAMQYSRGYANDKAKGTKYTFWSKDFDSMALKTMFRQLISKYGVMSIELEKAYVHDTTFSEDLPSEEGDSTPIYFDTQSSLDADYTESK